MITPTNGRIVWFTPGSWSISDLTYWGTPLAATVCHVWSDRSVNLLVTDAKGKQFPFGSVQLLQDGDLKPIGSNYAEWMPYQKGQAAKADASA